MLILIFVLLSTECIEINVNFLKLIEMKVNF